MIIQRDKYLGKIYTALKSLPIVVLSGARQVGKTTLMKSLKLQGNTLFLNGQNHETAAFFQKYSTIESYLKIHLNSTVNGFLLIDEFQFIPKISTMLKLLTDGNEALKIICSGSSSLDIIQKVEESLAGRVRIIDVYSLSFDEYLTFTDPLLNSFYTQYDENTSDPVVDNHIRTRISEYLLYGGLPRIALLKTPDEKIESLDDIYKTYLMKDVRSYIRNEDSVGFNKLLKLIAAQIGGLLNINSLSKSCGLPYKKCEEYLYLLEQMYIIKTISPYLTNKRKEITKMKKVYFADLGLRNMIYNAFNDMEIRIDNGAIFENFVFLELIKNCSKASAINFYRTKDGAEVDFVIMNLKEKVSVEAKFSNFVEPNYIKHLVNFNSSEQIARSYLVNRNFNGMKDNIKFVQGYLAGKIST